METEAAQRMRLPVGTFGNLLEDVHLQRDSAALEKVQWSL